MNVRTTMQNEKEGIKATSGEGGGRFHTACRLTIFKTVPRPNCKRGAFAKAALNTATLEAHTLVQCSTDDKPSSLIRLC